MLVRPPLTRPRVPWKRLLATPSPASSTNGSLQKKEFAELHWTGTFEEYLEVVRKNPTVARSAYQRVYDMILSYGQEEYIDNKKRLVRYNFFKDEHHRGRDAIFGLDIPLMRLVNVFKSAAERYGTERRVILLHGPVGSSKSTIARLLKRGSRSIHARRGALYTLLLLPKECILPVGTNFLCPCTRAAAPDPPDWRDKARSTGPHNHGTIRAG